MADLPITQNVTRQGVTLPSGSPLQIFSKFSSEFLVVLYVS